MRFFFFILVLWSLTGCSGVIADTPELRARMGEYDNEPCLDIKGNISSSGEKIYHVSGQLNYERTKIDKEGEAFFCTEEEAQEAGFRKALQ